jgi:archaellum component FlaC
LARVNHLDQEQDYDSAIELADTLIAQSTEIRFRAQNLSKELKVMTQSLDKIYSSSARESALNSINARVEMINSLLAYSDRLTDLLNALKDRFAGNSSQHTSNVVDLVNKINEEVSQVNQFNQKATDEMNVFDEIVRGR